MKIKGTADSVIIIGDTAYLLDWKFGRLSVTAAEHNLQAKAYALGVLQKFAHVKTVIVHLVSPRRDEVTKARYQRRDIPAMQAEINAVIEASQKADRQPVVNPACKYCGVISTCPEHLKTTMVLAGQNELQLPAYEQIANLSNDELGRLIALTNQVKPMFKDVDAELKARIKAGEEIPGVQVRERRNPRSFTDSGAVLNILIEMGEVELAQQVTTLKPKQLMEAARATGNQQLCEILEERVEEYLAPESKTKYPVARCGRTNNCKTPTKG